MRNGLRPRYRVMHRESRAASEVKPLPIAGTGGLRSLAPKLPLRWSLVTRRFGPASASPGTSTLSSTRKLAPAFPSRSGATSECFVTEVRGPGQAISRGYRNKTKPRADRGAISRLGPINRKRRGQRPSLFRNILGTSTVTFCVSRHCKYLLCKATGVVCGRRYGTVDFGRARHRQVTLVAPMMHRAPACSSDETELVVKEVAQRGGLHAEDMTLHCRSRGRSTRRPPEIARARASCRR